MTTKAHHYPIPQPPLWAEGTGVSRRPLRVLVIDPSNDNRNRTLDALRGAGFLAEGLVDGATALAAIEDAAPDLVLSELEMTGLDGRELLAALRSCDETATIPMVIVTDDADLDTRVELLEAGVTDVLSKWIAPAELTARVRAYAQSSRTMTRLRTQCEVDPLTGTLNRRGLRRALDRELEQSRRSGAPLSLLLVDIDRFKEINDRFGHLIGDDVLRSLADTLTSAVRGGDVVARLGGDEFVVVLSGGDADATAEVADRIREEVALIRVADTDHQITLSIGSVVEQEGGRGVERLLDAADRAMYRDKARSRARTTA